MAPPARRCAPASGRCHWEGHSQWFTKGFDTEDLQEAKALLAELAEG
ncbi:MAG: hypothetical protein HY268_26810 [Deltaproteobacteria bacterium]|nr:hypothetical protein [Deltaproteobacteria bacterium]